MEMLAGYGLTDPAIAHCLEISPEKLARWKRENETVGKTLEKGRSRAQGLIAKALFRKATGEIVTQTKDGKDVYSAAPDLGAIVWWEKTRANRHEVFRQEHTGRKGGPIELMHRTDQEVRDEIYEELNIVVPAERQPEGAT
jgi:hypothetical protein